MDVWPRTGGGGPAQRWDRARTPEQNDRHDKKITFPQHRWREVKKRSVVHTRSLKITGSDLPPEPLSIIEAAFRNSVRMRTIATNQS